MRWQKVDDYTDFGRLEIDSYVYRVLWGNMKTMELTTTPGGGGAEENKIRIVRYSQIINFTVRLYIIL